MLIIGTTLTGLFILGIFAYQCAGYSLGEYNKREAVIFTVLGTIMQVGAVSSAIILATAA